MKRGFLYLLLLVMIISIVSAQHTAEISWIQKPNQFYEGQTQEFIVSVLNQAQSKNGITNVYLNITPLTYTFINDQAWEIQNTSDSNEWYNGFIGRKANQAFTFNATASFVNQDTSTQLKLLLKDANQETSSFNLDLTILKDNIKPVINSFSPQNYQIIKSQQLPFTIQAQDDQSGLKQTLLRYCSDDNATNCVQYIETSPQTLDLTQFNKPFINYQFVARDNVNNEQITAWNNLFIDNQNPTLQINLPENNKIINITPEFKYLVSDNSFNLSNNFNSTLICSLLINNNLILSQSVLNTNEQSLQTNLNDGVYDWQIQCKDKAENIITSDKRKITLDSTGPEIIITAPEKIYRRNQLDISLDIKDILTDVQDVKVQLKTPDTINLDLAKSGTTYTSSYQITSDAKIGEYTLEVTANDSLNNTNNKTKIINVYYNFDIDLNLNTNSINPGQSITASGKVTYDNGTILSNASIILKYPDSHLDLQTDNDGLFSTSFTPSTSGEVYVFFTAENQETYISTKKSITIAQSGSSSGAYSGGSNGNSNKASSSGGENSEGSTESSSEAPAVTGNAVRSSPTTSSEESASQQSSDLSAITGKTVSSRSSNMPLAFAVSVAFFLMSLGLYIAKKKGLLFKSKEGHEFHKEKLKEFKKN